jgi:hypothetical protein
MPAHRTMAAWRHAMDLFAFVAQLRVVRAVLAVTLLAVGQGAHAQPPYQFRLDTVSAWGGAVNAFQKVKNIGYCGSGLRFLVLDMTDETNIHEVGSINLGTTVEDVVIRGGYAYVLHGVKPYHFSVLDVSVPASPRMIWTETTACSAGNSKAFQRIQVYGNLAYLVDPEHEAVWIYDLTDPVHPALLQTAPSSCTYDVTFGAGPDWTLPFDLKIVGNYAYTVGQNIDLDGRDYLSIFSLQPDALHPTTLIGRVDLGTSDVGPVFHLAVANGKAVVQITDQLGRKVMRIADVSDPANPSLVGAYDDFYRANGVAIQGNLAFVADWLVSADGNSPSGLMVFDISNPAAPALVGTYNTNHSSIRDVRVSGSRAYVFCDGQGLVVLNIANPAQPARVGGYYSPSELRTLSKDGNRLFAVDDFNGFTILDVSNPSATPVVVGVYRSPEPIGRQGHWNVQVRGNWAYVSAAHLGIEVVDISNPAAPSRAFLYSEPTADFGMYSVELDGNVLHASYQLAVNQWRFGNFDVSNPLLITKIGQFSPLSQYRRMQTRLGITFVSTGISSIIVGRIDNRIPASPYMYTGNVNDPWGGNDLEISGTLLYAVGQSTHTLSIVDITDPLQPVLTGLATANHAVGVSGLRAHVDALGLNSLDVSTPASPQVIANSPTGLEIDILAEGDMVYSVLGPVASGLIGGSPPELGGIVIHRLTCYANCDGSAAAPVLNANDFQCFLNKFAGGDLYANCDGSTAAPVLNANDFQCFLNMFAAGCS